MTTNCENHIFALFVKVPSAGTVTVTVTVPVAPGASGGRIHVTTPAAFDPPPVALANAVPGGSVSVSRTFSTGRNPGFE